MKTISRYWLSIMNQNGEPKKTFHCELHSLSLCLFSIFALVGTPILFSMSDKSRLSHFSLIEGRLSSHLSVMLAAGIFVAALFQVDIIPLCS
jgi:hypothetical protein